MKELEHQVRRISRYVESQALDERVMHVERMMSTKIIGRDYEVWDVRTDADRYWVVTNPTNLYSQEPLIKKKFFKRQTHPMGKNPRGEAAAVAGNARQREKARGEARWPARRRACWRR